MYVLFILVSFLGLFVEIRELYYDIMEISTHSFYRYWIYESAKISIEMSTYQYKFKTISLTKNVGFYIKG